jgi:hypothetical protein
MASSARIAASRRNATKSTGPQTVGGAAVVSRNALRHGLTAAQVVVFDETADSFAAFHAELHAVYQPADAVEEELVERIVLCAWRLRRAAWAESGMIDDAVEQLQTWRVETIRYGRAFGIAGLGLGRVMNYESAIDRALRRAQMQLERRQARRRGEAVAPPLAVTVLGLEGGDGVAAEIKIDKTKPISESVSMIDTESASLAPHPPADAGPSLSPLAGRGSG